MKQDVSFKRTIRLNGSDIEITADEPSKDLGSFLNSVNDELSKSQQVVTQIQIDGKPLAEGEASIKSLPVEKVGLIEIFTSTPQDLAYETLNTLEQYIDRIMQVIERAAVFYKNKNFVAGDNYFLKGIDGLDLFIQTISGIKMAIKLGVHPKVALAEAGLISTMNDVLEAKQQGNTVFMSELLEKDLITNLQEWKNDIFPILRMWKNS